VEDSQGLKTDWVHILNRLDGNYNLTIILQKRMSSTSSSTIFYRIVCLQHRFTSTSNRTKWELCPNFNSNGVFGELTAIRARQLVAPLQLTIKNVIIADAKYGVDFIKALIDRVKELHNLKELTIEKTLVGGEEEGRDVGLQLANALSTSTSPCGIHTFSAKIM